MIVKVVTDQVCYVDMDGVLFYLDNSTNEKIVTISVPDEHVVEINGHETMQKQRNEKDK